MSTELVLAHDLNGHVVGQRKADGFINATSLCKAAGKLWADYWRLGSTKEFLGELSGSMGIPIDQLTNSVLTGPNDLRGTWVHPDVGINLAQWCSARFAVQVSKWVRELLAKGRVELRESTGDDILDACADIQRSLAVTMENRRLALALAREVTEVREIAEGAREAADGARATALATLGTVNNRQGYVTVLGYCRLTGREVTEPEAQRYGRIASASCRRRGISPQSTGDARYGRVNIYPLSVLQEVFNDPEPPPM